MRRNRKRKSNKPTKQDTLNKVYNRAYNNYLKRVRTQIQYGYAVNIHKKAKKPTQASIDYINTLKAKQIREKSDLYDIVNDRYLSPGEEGRVKALKDNNHFLKLSPFEQEVALSIKSLDKQLIADMTVETPDEPADAIDALIEKWYETIEGFKPQVQAQLRERTDELIRRDRVAFANVIENHGGLLPAVNEYKGEVINAAFNEISDVMEWSRTSGELEGFMNSYGIVENE